MAVVVGIAVERDVNMLRTRYDLFYIIIARDFVAEDTACYRLFLTTYIAHAPGCPQMIHANVAPHKTCRSNLLPEESRTRIFYRTRWPAARRTGRRRLCPGRWHQCNASAH